MNQTRVKAISINKRSLKTIDELTLNKLLDSLPADVNQDFIKRQLPPLSKTRVHIKLNDSENSPKFICSLVKDLGLLDEPSMMRRYDLCLGFFRHRRYSINTVRAGANWTQPMYTPRAAHAWTIL